MMLEATIFAEWMKENCSVQFCEDCTFFKQYEHSPIKRCGKLSKMRRVFR